MSSGLPNNKPTSLRQSGRSLDSCQTK